MRHLLVVGLVLTVSVLLDATAHRSHRRHNHPIPLPTPRQRPLYTSTNNDGTDDIVVVHRSLVRPHMYRHSRHHRHLRHTGKV
ncbi:hypothetical protein V3C99_012839 [Haemonchus contortus]|uniref:Secreted protein n=1 Tax=Haemonchus contortus TaxID=6289 RepID=A0A7I4Y4E0_HAECO